MSKTPTYSRPSERQPKVRQACDECHVRKIRCDGRKPCINCQGLEKACTYLAVHKKTGPRGPRYAQRSCRGPSIAAVRCSIPSPDKEIVSPAPNTPNSPSSKHEFLPSPAINDAVVRWCLDAYFKHKYPLTPILHRQQLEQTPVSAEQYGLIAACCAIIALSPEILPPSATLDNLTLPSSEFLISETLRSREYCNLVEHPSLNHIRTSFFLYAAFFAMDKENSAWYYLQEAISMLQALRLHEEAAYSNSDDGASASYARRMYWVLFITERAYALQRNRPIRLQDMLALPVVDPTSSDAEILLGFLDLISLFRPFDAEFITQWNLATPSTMIDSAHLSSLQCLLKYALPNLANYSQVQQADLLISRQWLKMVVWKLCASNRVLSTTNSQDVMSLHYPASIAREIVLVSQLVPTQAFEANGIGILEKVFDVGCSLADLLTLVPLGDHGSAMDIGVVDTLMEMVRIVGTRFGGTYRHLNILVEKANGCLLTNVDRSLPLPDDERCAIVEEI